MMLRSLRNLHLTSSRVLSLTHTHIPSHSRWFAAIGPVEYQKQHEIKVKGCEIDPVEEFSGTPFPEKLQNRLSKSFDAPTPIQAQTWPIAVSGRDMIGIARTGSGKTLAYLLPGFLRIIKATPSKRKTPKILIIVPTRELAVQIQKESNEYGALFGINTVALYGGVSKVPQVSVLNKGCDVIVGTPGRLNDLLDNGALFLDNVSYLVLDEADRMLDMGFEPQISSIIRELPEHQTAMFTATWPAEVQDLANEYLKDPVQVRIGHAAGSDLVLPKTIKHEILNVAQRDKQNKFIEIIRPLQEMKRTVLVFANTKLTCEILHERLKAISIRCGTLHGDISQHTRQLTIENLRNNKMNIVIATDVAARGLDISNITDVINYDFPSAVQDWIHRVGRTGRAGRDGIAHTLFEPRRDARHAPLLSKVLSDAGHTIPFWLTQLTAAETESRFGRSSSSSSRFGGRRTTNLQYAKTSSLKTPKENLLTQLTAAETESRFGRSSSSSSRFGGRRTTNLQYAKTSSLKNSQRKFAKP